MKPILFAIIFILLVYEIHKLNPLWLNLNENSIVDGQLLNPGIPLPFQVSKHPGLKEPSFQYRQNIQRTGVSEQRLELPFVHEQSLLSKNYGIHGASKSSVSVDQWGFLVPLDTSWIHHYDHNYNLTWKFFVSESVRGIHGTAVLTENAVYIGAYNGRFYALDRKTGKPIWVYKLGGAIGASPVLWDGHIYIAVERVDIVDGYLVKLKAETGELVWKSRDIGEQAHSSPTIDPELGIIYFGANNEKFFAVSDIDGSIKWEYKANGQIKGTASLSESCVIFSDWSGLLYCLRRATGQLKWSASLERKSQSSPTFIEDIDVIVVSANKGHIFGIRHSDGEILWQKKVENNIMTGSATAFKSKKKGQWNVITPCGKKELCVLDAMTGKQLQKLEVPSLVTSVPSLFADKIYITTHDNAVEIFKSNDR